MVNLTIRKKSETDQNPKRSYYEDHWENEFENFWVRFIGGVVF